MSEVNITSEVPIGEAGRVRQHVQANRERHLVLSAEVKNHVLMVNPDVMMPFKIEEGKPTNLARFATAALAFRERFGKVPREEKILEGWSGHGRSAILERVIFRDREGRFYRDVDLKGIGFLEFNRATSGSGEVTVSGPGQRGPRWRDTETPWGLLPYKFAKREYQISEDFLKLGIRTYRILAIIGLEEIISGSKMSEKEAIKRGLFGKRFRPVIAVRAFGTRARLSDLAGSRVKEDERAVLIADAKKMIQEELKGGELSNEDYLKWFARTLGYNLRLMHENEWIHQQLTDHNVTLDCRIVDLVRARKARGRGLTREIGENIRDAKFIVYGLARRLGIDEDIGLDDMDKALSVREFIDAYNKPSIGERVP